MRSFIFAVAAVLITTSGFADDLENYRRDTDALWRTGTGSEDGTFTAIATSMVGWGIGLSAGIAILASVLHQSTASSHSHTCSHTH